MIAHLECANINIKDKFRATESTSFADSINLSGSRHGDKDRAWPNGFSQKYA